MNDQMTVTKTYSVSFETIARVNEMAGWTGLSQGAVVRAAVARLYRQLCEPEALQEFVNSQDSMK